MAGVLYVSDLDGTLLLPDGSLGVQTVKTVNTFIADGGLFSIATARSFHSVRRVASELRLELPVIAYNGATAVHPVTGIWSNTKTIPEFVVRTVLSDFAREGLHPVVYAIDKEVDRFCWIDRDPPPSLLEFVGAPPRSLRALPLRSWSEIDLAAVFYISLIGAERALKEFTRIRGCHAVLDRYANDPDSFCLELTSESASKGRGVTELKREVGADRLVVFGDSLSDLTMFAAADESYAVDSAVTEVRARATKIIGGNAQQGVAAWLASRDPGT